MEYVPREEFSLYIRQQNGTLKRIEEGIGNLSEKIDCLREELNLRVTWDAYDRHKQECKEELRRLRGRPSWAVALILTFLSSSVTSLLVLVLTHAIR